MKVERFVIIICLFCVIVYMCTCGWAMREFKRIEAEREIAYSNRVKPQIEKIIVYADDDPPVIKKQPPDIIQEDEDEIVEEIEEIILPNLVLNATLGRVQGPIEQETYYNLPMENVIQKMRNMGYTEIDYPYYVREDGVKMLGDFIMVAANLNKYPRGTVVQTSLGQGLVCDMCEHGQELDIAVEW